MEIEGNFHFGDLAGQPMALVVIDHQPVEQIFCAPRPFQEQRFVDAIGQDDSSSPAENRISSGRTATLSSILSE